MSDRIETNGLSVALPLYDLVVRDIAPGTGVEPDRFWAEFSAIIRDMAPKNRELLEKLASVTGGKYWNANDLAKLPGEVSLSEAGITVRETKDLWNLPIVFFVLCVLKGAEWLLRRKWGVV